MDLWLFFKLFKRQKGKNIPMFERDLVAKGCNTYKHCVMAIIVRIWILNLSCLRSERMSGMIDNNHTDLADLADLK